MAISLKWFFGNPYAKIRFFKSANVYFILFSVLLYVSKRRLYVFDL